MFLPLLLVLNVARAALPLVDFDRMGLVGVAGAFAGLDFYSNSSYSLNPSSASIISRAVDGSLAYIASTNPGGRVVTACALNDIVYLAGSFSSIGEVQLLNIASYNPSSNSFSPLGNTNDAPNGHIDVVFCDTRENKVWVGGNITSPGHAVAVYDTEAASWSPPPFDGLIGAQSRVLSISTNVSEDSLFFGGSFVTHFQGSGSPPSQGQNNPNVPYSAGATPFSSSLVPIPLQGAQILGSPSSNIPGFTNIKNILCPTGSDGPGNTWFGEDGSPALITIRAFSFLSASGVRLGNTFQTDRGTTQFSVTTIPDNQVQTLSYVDPVSGQILTCATCPLATDASVLYQDFLFQSPLSITGVQLKISAFEGLSPGLHIVQILSSGAFASAVARNNRESCFAPNSSNVTLVGSWKEKLVDTSIAATTQSVLVSTVRVGTPSSSAPSITWMPYISAAGNYDITLLVPGCANLQDCDLRTSVKVTVFPGAGSQPSVTTISQTNQQDAPLLIYSGPVLPSSSSFALTVTMTLADNPQESGQDGKYDIVADRIQLVLKSTNGSTNSSGNGTLGTQGTNNGFGLFEWPLGGATANATTTLTNSSETTFDSIGVDLFSGIGIANVASDVFVKAVAHHPSGVVYLGGKFSLSSGSASGAGNIVAYKDGTLTGLPGRGLNGAVTSIVIYGNLIFVGGSFSDAIDGSSQGVLRGLALYNSQQNQWQPLGGGVDGVVTALALSGSQLLVAGNFTKAFLGNGENGIEAAGFAAWNVQIGEWVNSGGFLVSELDMVNNVSSTMQLLAGNVSALEKFGASGLVMLKNGGNGGPSLTPFGIQLAAGGATTSISNITHRNWHSSPAAHLLERAHFSRLSARQSSSSGQLVRLPPSPPAIAPAILAGAFWTNNSRELVIVGGNFSYMSATSQFSSVAIYDAQSMAIQGLAGQQINGTVRALLVDHGRLYVGGEFTLSGSSANGLAVYDLFKKEWNATGLQPLQANSLPFVVVRSITRPLSGNVIVVAGSFSAAGALSCTAICSFDVTTLQWNLLGKGIEGEVASVAYAGANQDLLIAAGSMKLADGTITGVAQYSLTNETWTSLGSGSDLPGPVTAVEVNDGKVNSIFAAGRSNDDSTSFLSFWNGSKWTILESTLESNTTITQLRMVPLQNTHGSNDIIQSDRALMVSGLLNDSTFGNASTALFDGQRLTPYIVTLSVSGTAGYVASLFHSIADFSFVQRHFLAVGVVILISIAIAAGVVFLLALIGILWTLFSRRDDRFNKVEAVEEDDDSSLHHRPSSLLEHINAATRTTILGTSPYSNYNSEKEEEKANKDGLEQDVFGADASNYVRAETPSDAVGGIMTPEEVSRPAHARYSFDGGGEGELPISAGAEVEVLDDRDPSWWFARDVQTGQEGVVPAAYLY
ncbi:hypothetical protein APHAL10511_000072 [Amanita phalloides]|nr:hypothetical protein APHAL10511_000072 [Amanita phalloides]